MNSKAKGVCTSIPDDTTSQVHNTAIQWLLWEFITCNKFVPFGSLYSFCLFGNRRIILECLSPAL